jgi:hypothetical protein
MRYSLLIFCIFLGLRIAYSQNNNYGTTVSTDKPARARSIEDMESQKLKSPSWMLDSAWYSQWLSSITDWYIFQKEFLYYNVNAQINEDLFRTYNMNTGQWENANRYLRLYNSSSSLKTVLGQAWYPAGSTWVTYSSNHYDDMGRTDSMYYKSYNAQTNSFTSGFLNLFFYNTSNMMDETLTQFLDTASGNWENNIRSQYSYSPSGQMTECLTQLWNSGTALWDNYQKTTYTFDPGGFSTGSETFNWQTATGQWIPLNQYITTNNTSGQPVETLYQIWNQTSSAWENSQKTVYQYNAGGLVQHVFSQQWIVASSSWRDYSKDDYTYYLNNVQKTRYSYFWNPLTSVWMETWFNRNDSLGYNLEYSSRTIDPNTYTYLFGYRYSYTYNTSHQLSEYLNQSLEVSSNTWINSGKRSFTYDSYGNNTEQLDQTWNQSGSAWDNYFRLENFYSIFTGIKPAGISACHCLFANPVHRGSPVQCQGLSESRTYTLTLTGLTGQIASVQYFRAGSYPVIPQGIAGGVYILRIMEGSKPIWDRKVVVKD